MMEQKLLQRNLSKIIAGVKADARGVQQKPPLVVVIVPAFQYIVLIANHSLVFPYQPIRNYFL